MNPQQVLLDTNIVIAHFRNDPGVRVRLLECDRICVPLFVLAELLGGVRRSRDPEGSRKQVLEFVEACELLLPDAATAEHFANIEFRLRTAGTPLPIHDVWIAAMAEQSGLPLATRDDHFRAVEQIQLLRW